MVSFAVRHVSDTALQGPRVLASRRNGASSGRVIATRQHFGIAMSYQIDEQNGSALSAVNVVFPGTKYASLDYTPARTGYRFLGWYDAASGGNQVYASDSVRYGVSPIYAHWQDHVTVTFDATTNGGAMPQGWTAPYYFAGQPFGTLPSPTHPTLNFGGWLDGNGNRVTAASIVPEGGMSLTAIYVSSSYTVDMSGYNGSPGWVLGDPSNPITYTYTHYDEWYNEDTDEWEYGEREDTATLIPPSNPDPSLYDGVYCSMNAGSDDTTAWMKIHVIGYTSFRIFIRSDAESSYDYSIALHADETPEGIPNGWEAADSGKVKVSTKDNQNGGTDIYSYTPVDYDLDGGEHDIWVGFTKDGSWQEGEDRGFVLIQKVQGG